MTDTDYRSDYRCITTTLHGRGWKKINSYLFSDSIPLPINPDTLATAFPPPSRVTLLTSTSSSALAEI